MYSSLGAKRRKLSPTESVKSFPSSNVSSHETSIASLPPELLSAIIDYVPKRQWPSLELVNRSFRDAVYSVWQSMKEFDIDKDVLHIRQSFDGARLSSLLPSILSKLLLRSPMLTSIIGFPSINRDNDEATTTYRSEILHTVCQFTNLKGIDYGDCGLRSVDLVEFLASSASRHRLKEINSSAVYKIIWKEPNWPAIFTAQKNSESQSSRLKLEKLFLKNEYGDVLLDPRILDLIDPSSLTALVLVRITAPSDYLLSLITNCNQLQRLQFSFMAKCRCEKTPCVHLTSSKQILELIPAMENLDSLKIGLIYNGASSYFDNRDYLNIKDDFPVLIDRLGRRGRLIELGLLHPTYCSDQIITEIADHLTDLKSLELLTPKCAPETLVNMIKKMVSLEKLVFSGSSVAEWNRAITPMVLKAVATHLKNLRHFHLWNTRQIYDCHECLDLLRSMNRLEELTIVGARGEKVGVSAFGHQLQFLEIRNCSQEFVASVLKHVPGLRRLVLYESFYLSNTVLRMIPTSCPRLREFYLDPSWGDAKKGVKTIIDGCPELQQLRY